MFIQYFCWHCFESTWSTAKCGKESLLTCDIRGFPNNIKGWRTPPSPRGGLEILVGNFLIGCWEPKEAWFWPFGRFLKLKTFCKYWTSIEIKISMTYVYKEYEIKIKIIDEWWLQLKMKLHWVIAWRLLFSGGINLCCEGRNENLVGRFF